MEALMDERTFVDSHGVEIFARWRTIYDPGALVLISHGASEHSGRYDRFATSSSTRRTETTRDEITADIISWLARREPAPR
jgi:alpha-beta hydrolase superfamily lysophospholipase